jgi:hypothetical protein
MNYSTFHSLPISSSPELTSSSSAHNAKVKKIFAQRHHTCDEWSSTSQKINEIVGNEKREDTNIVDENIP